MLALFGNRTVLAEFLVNRWAHSITALWTVGINSMVTIITQHSSYQGVVREMMRVKWTEPSRLTVDSRTLSRLTTSVFQSLLINTHKQNINGTESRKYRCVLSLCKCRTRFPWNRREYRRHDETVFVRYHKK